MSLSASCSSPAKRPRPSPPICRGWRWSPSAFPKYTDGRGYSTARILRDRYKFAGELRAVGDILFDQIQLYRRCGFDTLEINDPVTIKLLEAGRKPVMTHFYQPGEGRRGQGQQKSLAASVRDIADLSGRHSRRSSELTSPSSRSRIASSPRRIGWSLRETWRAQLRAARRHGASAAKRAHGRSPRSTPALTPRRSAAEFDARGKGNTDGSHSRSRNILVRACVNDFVDRHRSLLCLVFCKLNNIRLRWMSPALATLRLFLNLKEFEFDRCRFQVRISSSAATKNQ